MITICFPKIFKRLCISALLCSGAINSRPASAHPVANEQDKQTIASAQKSKIPADAQGFADRAQERCAAGDLKGGLQDYDRAIVLNPRLAEAYLGRGTVHLIQRELKEAKTDVERLSAMIVLCQLHLLTDRRIEYAELAMNQLLPLARRVLDNAMTDKTAISSAVALTMLPLAVGEFSSSFNKELLRQICDKISKWPQAPDDVDFICQHIVRTMGQSLRDAATTEKAERRLANHPARARWNLNKDTFDLEYLRQFRRTLMLPELLRAVFG